MSKDLIVIPARIGSSRMPGKPLAPVAGTPLLIRVVRNALAASSTDENVDVVVAVDDDRVSDLLKNEAVCVVRTDPEIGNGTLRTLSAVRSLCNDPRNVISLQGDAPFVLKHILLGLLRTLRHDDVDIVTPVVRLDWAGLDRLRANKRLVPFTGTSCVRAGDGRALWFSKTIIPAIRNEARLRTTDPMSPVWQHIGLYGFSWQALQRTALLPTGEYEPIEGLEQLRMLEAGEIIQTVPVEWGPWSISGIDTPADVVRAEQEIAQFGDPLEQRA